MVKGIFLHLHFSTCVISSPETVSFKRTIVVRKSPSHVFPDCKFYTSCLLVLCLCIFIIFLDSILRILMRDRKQSDIKSF